MSLRTEQNQSNAFCLTFSLALRLTFFSFFLSSSGLESLWRNAITDVVKVLKENHGDNFRVWNLSEKETAEDQVGFLALSPSTFSCTQRSSPAGPQGEMDTVRRPPPSTPRTLL